MVDNRNRKTKYQDISFTIEAANEFIDCAEKGESRSETLLKISRFYKNKCKCLGHEDQGVVIAD